MHSNETQGNATDPIPAGAILALSLAAFGSAVSVRLADALLPALSAEFSVSLAQAASAVTSFSVAYGLAQLFFGPVGDRFGKYLVIAWACAACAVTAAMCALAPGFGWLVAARLCAGATCAAIVPLSMAWIGDVVPYAQRQPVLARFLIGQIMGVSGGVVLGGIAADHLGRHTPFWGIAVAFVAIFALLLRLNRRLPARARIVRHGSDHALRRMVAEFGEVLALPWARVLLLTVFLEGVFLFGAFAFIASHLHQRFGLSLAVAGGMVMLFGFGGVLFAMCASVLVRRLGEVRLAAVGGSIVASALASIGWVPLWWWAMPASVVAGLGYYMLHNTLQTNATQMAPERRGAAVSAFACCFFLGQAAGVSAVGLAATRVGTGPAIMLGGCGVLAVALCFAHLRARRPVLAPQAAG